MAFSVGQIWAIIGGFCYIVSFRPISSPRSIFPTSTFFLCLPVRIVGGSSLSSQCYDSLFSHLLEINYRRKPPWSFSYIHHSSVSPFFSPVSESYRHQFVSLMGDKPRNYDPDPALGFVDAPITLSPVTEYCVGSTTRFMHSRWPHLSDLIGPRLWVLVLVDDCVGRFFHSGKFRFRFRNEESLNWAFRRESREFWPFNDWMLPIHWWFPNIMTEASTIWNRINDSKANVPSTGYGRVQMIWIVDKVLLWKQKPQYFLVLMEFTQFGRLEDVLASLRWIFLVIRGLDRWDVMVDLFDATLERITQAQFFKETLVRKCWCHYVYIPELDWDTSALMLRFVKRGHSQKLLSPIRNKEKSNMKLDNNRFLDRLASKATLRKASSNSLLLYFLLVYGTYICVCNNCISLILYVLMSL